MLRLKGTRLEESKPRSEVWDKRVITNLGAILDGTRTTHYAVCSVHMAPCLAQPASNPESARVLYTFNFYFYFFWSLFNFLRISVF